MQAISSDIDQRLFQARQFMERVFGFREFRPGQEAILEAVLSGEDTLAVMPTGGGKSLCYQVPALILPGPCLVISPLIALMKDQVDTLRVRELPVVSIHSLMGMGEQEEALNKIAAGHCKMIYVSPERLRNGPFMGALRKWPVSLVAVDEAHCISEWGHDFRPDYLRIGQALDWIGRPQTIALTATATERVRADIIHHLKLRAPRQFITGFDRKNLYFEVVPVDTSKEKLHLLAGRLDHLQGGAIVYTGTRKSVETIVRHLNSQGMEAAGYHAGMEEEERSRIQEAFLEGRTDLIVATNAFGMGIDRSDIRMVIHYQLPGTIEAYYQECGRAGRDGERSLCLLLFSSADRRLQEFFIEASYPPREVVLGVYQALLQNPEDPIWLTYREIGHLCQPPVAEIAVGSSLKILEEAGLIHRLHRYENLAELYLKVGPEKILKSVSQRSPAKIAFLEVLCGHYTGDELVEGIQFLPEEIISKANLSKEAFRRVVTELEEKGEGTYIPPFRGRGLRLLGRMPPQELKIDFQRINLRKAHQLEKLNQMMTYGTLSRCRRAFLLEYFGEYYPSDNCDSCDLCQDRKQKPDVTTMDQMDPLLAVKILSGVARLKGRFGQGMAVKMLTGSKENSVEKFRLHQLSTYGLLAGYTQNQVETWIQELIGLGCLKQELTLLGERNYKVLLLTPKGKEFMKRREMVPLSAPSQRKIEEKTPEEKAEKADRGLFEELRKLRLELARDEGLPPYCIFHDRTLWEIANKLPRNRQEMMGIVGVGQITFEKYGRLFLDRISSYLHKEA